MLSTDIRLISPLQLEDVLSRLESIALDGFLIDRVSRTPTVSDRQPSVTVVFSFPSRLSPRPGNGATARGEVRELPDGTLVDLQVTPKGFMRGMILFSLLVAAILLVTLKTAWPVLIPPLFYTIVWVDLRLCTRFLNSSLLA